MSGVTTRVGPDVKRLPASHRGRLAHGDVGDTLSTQHRHEQEADGARPGDEDPIVCADIGQAQRVQGDGHRFGQRGHPGRQGNREFRSVHRSPPSCTGRTRRGTRRSRTMARFRHTEGRPRRHGRHAPQPGAGFPTTRSPGDQPESLGAAATMPDHSCPRMAPGFA